MNLVNNLPFLTLDTRMISIPDSVSQVFIKLNSNIPWKLKTKPDWVSQIQPASDSSFLLRYNSLKIAFESNPNYLNRKGIIYWKGGNLIDSLEVIQDSKKVILPGNWGVKPTNFIHQVLIFKNSTFN